MKLYVAESMDESGMVTRTREASPAELLEAARPHADYDAAIDAVWRAWREARPETATTAWTPSPDLLANAAIRAALGADDG